MIAINPPSYPVKHEVELPGSKSISNRLLIIRALSKLNVVFKNLSDSDDTVTLAKALGQIQNKRSAVINVEHAGTDMRFLTAFLSITSGEWTLTGSARMKERPISELVEGLRQLGADITYLEKEGFPPLKIKGQKLEGGSLELNASISSQFTSAMLLIAPFLTYGLEIKLKGDVVSRPYIIMTIELLKQFGVYILADTDAIHVKASDLKILHPSFSVESDWTAASYWYSIVALSENSEIVLKHLNKVSTQADSVLPELYKQLGVKTEFVEGGVKLSHQPVIISEFNYDFTNCPDIAQTIAATCVGLGIKANLTGLKTLKIKETDRIAALKNELDKFGVKTETSNESIKISAGSETKNTKFEIKTYNDHRMALSFAPLSLKFPGIVVKDPDVVNKSYPAFWDDLQEAGFNVD